MEEVLLVIRENIADYDWSQRDFLRLAFSDSCSNPASLEPLVTELCRKDRSSEVEGGLGAALPPGLVRYADLMTRCPRLPRSEFEWLKGEDFLGWATEARDSAAQQLLRQGAWADSLRASDVLVEERGWPPDVLLVRTEPLIRLGHIARALDELRDRLSDGIESATGYALALEVSAFLAAETGEAALEPRLSQVRTLLLSQWEDWEQDAGGVLAIAVLRGDFEFSERIWSLREGRFYEFEEQRLRELNERLRKLPEPARWKQQIEWLERYE